MTHRSPNPIPSVHAADSASASGVQPLPRSVVGVAVVLAVFIGLLCLEVSDSIVRHHGQIARSLFVLPVVSLLLWGLLSRRRWAWLITRIVAVLAAVLYVATIAAVWLSFAQLQTGLRIWISVVSAGLCSLALFAFIALGRQPARSYFRIQT